MVEVFLNLVLSLSLLLCTGRLAMETEQIGNATIDQMGRQREQLQGANTNIDATLAVARQASAVLTQM